MNPLVHFEIHATNPESLIDFYRSIFAWEFKKWAGGDFEYWLVMTCPKDAPNAINGGLVRRRGSAPAPDSPVGAYVATTLVESVDETIKKAEAAGGKLALPKFKIAEMAYQAYLTDPDGNLFGIHEPIKPVPESAIVK